nr:hypothetical protein [Allofranklinella schreckenbergeri]
MRIYRSTCQGSITATPAALNGAVSRLRLDGAFQDAAHLRLGAAPMLGRTLRQRQASDVIEQLLARLG